MRRGRPSASASPYRALSHHAHHAAASGALSDSSSLIRSFDVETNPARPVRPSPLAASTIRDMPLDLVERVRSFPLFQSAPGEFLIAVGNRMKPQVHGPNDHIVAEGDDAKAMYWLVRGVVAVTSRDGEAVYAELKPGAFFGEIGVLMDMPRTATIVARTKCLLLVLKKEDLQLVMPAFPEMEQAIMEEAQERLHLLKKKKKRHQSVSSVGSVPARPGDGAIAPRATAPGEVSRGESGAIKDGAVVKNAKKRKSPSPGIIEDPASGGSAIGSGLVNIRKTLKELPLFSTLPPDILHFLGLSVQPKTWPPFSEIIQQGSSGHEIYFIVQGEAEVVHDDPPVEQGAQQQKIHGVSIQARPRLRPGQYFGEVASLGLSADRTATVRSITTVECLVVPGEVLEELWRRCPPGIKAQVEETARRRYGARRGDGAPDIAMAGVGKPGPVSELPRLPVTPPTAPAGRLSMSKFLFSNSATQQVGLGGSDDSDMMGPKDPDPYLSVDMEKLRNRRRQSMAPPTPPSPQSEPSTPGRSNGIGRSPLTDVMTTPTKLDLAAQSPPDSSPAVRVKRAKTLTQRPAAVANGATAAATSAAAAARLDGVLARIFAYLDIGDVVRLRIVSRRWRHILTTSPDICREVNLSRYNRTVTDEVISGVLAPFIGARAVTVDLSNCFHITDAGFQALWRGCGKNVREWKMRSVWDVSASQILEMSENAKNLEEIDWSNCRKVGDNLLGRVVGWVVPSASLAAATAATRKRGNAAMASPSSSPPPGQLRDKKRTRTRSQAHQAAHENGRDDGASKKTHDGAATLIGPGTVIGCPKLSKLNLSYCKHVTDRSMAHMAVHASARLQSLSLTRCTSITDAGFQSWTAYKFAKLTHLCLADCTYLSDGAIVALVSSAKNLTHLDLSFCCALSDTSTEVVALGLPRLRELRMAFCGSAVSDGSLESISLHLAELEGLSVRGCVRVTGGGLESVLGGCQRLAWVDVSQCRNLEEWLSTGSLAAWGYDDRGGKRRPGMLPTPATMANEEDMADGTSGPRKANATTAQAKPTDPGTMLPTPGLLSMPRFGGLMSRQARPPVRFIVEKGFQGLR